MRSRRRRSLLAGVVLGVSLLMIPERSSARLGADITRTGARKDAPAFSLIDSKGKSVKLSDYKGRVVLLDFWATWCTGCKVEIPWYVAFQQKYKSMGLTSIGVAMDDEGWEVVKPYLAQHPIGYPIVLGNDGPAKQYDVTNLPLTLLIDRNGKIADSHLGIVDKIAWENEIRQLLQEKAR